MNKIEFSKSLNHQVWHNVKL